MKIYSAIIVSKDEYHTALASSAQGRMEKLATYCRENWDHIKDGSAIPEGEAMRVVEHYFDASRQGTHEYVVMFEPEEVE